MQRKINEQDKEEYKADQREHDKMNMDRQKRWKEWEDQLRAPDQSLEKEKKKKKNGDCILF